MEVLLSFLCASDVIQDSSKRTERRVGGSNEAGVGERVQIYGTRIRQVSYSEKLNAFLFL